MDASFWFERWREGRIGFHEGRPNELLARHVARLGEGRRVLVPLCGKAHDLAYLAARGHDVVGVELVEDAVRAFFDEHGIAPSVARRGGYVVYEAAPITILVGDFFAATRADVGAVDALYDRAAIVALPAELRVRYAARVRVLLPPGAPGLVVTFEGREGGPPFAVPEAELRDLYAGLAVELVDEVARDAPVVERCWAVTF